jgi:hypothetical protein
MASPLHLAGLHAAFCRGNAFQKGFFRCAPTMSTPADCSGRNLSQEADAGAHLCIDMVSGNPLAYELDFLKF